MNWLERLRDWWRLWGSDPIGWCGNTEPHEGHAYSVETDIPDDAWGYEHLQYRCPGNPEDNL